MRNKKPIKRIYGVLLVLYVMALGIQSNAAKALNKALATAASSVH